MKNSKRLAAFLLVAALMAGLLAGCGSPEGEQATDAPGQEATGLVWTSEFTDLGGAAGYVSRVSFAVGKFYFSTSDDDGEAQRSVGKVWCVDAAAGAMGELTGYAPPAAAQESEGRGSFILPSRLRGTGCLEPGEKSVSCAECAIRACALSSHIPHCGFCPDFPCDLGTAVWEAVPEYRHNLEVLRSR